MRIRVDELENEGISSLTKCEQMVMKTIWDAADEELGLQDVMERVNAKYKRDWKPQTVSTFLARLASKGFLKYYRKGRIFYYTILIPIDEYRSKVTSDFVDFWDNGNADQAIADLMHYRPLRPEEISGIKELLKNL